MLNEINEGEKLFKETDSDRNELRMTLGFEPITSSTPDKPVIPNPEQSPATKALEYLMMQPKLSELTLSSWLMGKRPIGNILTSLFVDRSIRMLKTGREWCPDCLQEWQNRDRDI